MIKENVIYSSIPTKKKKLFPYKQYYLGEIDESERRNGYGQNCWSGAQSLESYTGRFLRDTMHGVGEYRWRYKGVAGINITYEGHFFGNNMNGYGLMSYSDGKVFNGHFYNNIRWGPGIQSQPCLREDVGLWHGAQLIRLTWRPSAPSITPDLMTNNNGRMCVEQNRIIMARNIKKVGEINTAFEMLKQYGCEPLSATKKWSKLYPKYCTDLNSALCDVDAFDHDYYKGEITTLEEVVNLPQETIKPQNSEESFANKELYFAWNNNPNNIHMMKICYKHESQRNNSGIDLVSILSGPRSNFKPAGKHELDCRTVLMASYLGDITNVVQLVNECQVNVNVTDVQGNSSTMYATCGDQPDIIHFLIEAGANVDEFNDACCTPLTIALLRYAFLVNDITPNIIVQALLPQQILPAPAHLFCDVLEWNINRDTSAFAPDSLTRTGSKINKTYPKSTLAKNISKQFKKQLIAVKSDIQASNSIESITEETRLYHNTNTEFTTRVNTTFQLPNPLVSVPYIFEVYDMNKDIDSNEMEQKKVTEKNPKRAISKIIKNTTKPSREIIGQGMDEDEYSSVDNAQNLKMNMLSKTMPTILQLLIDGANPKLVRCPQPALFIAIVAGSADLVRHLVHYGADINEMYPHVKNYTALDVAVSRSLTHENLEIIKTLLDLGAETKHRLPYRDPSQNDSNLPEVLGPSLLHAVLAKKPDNEVEEQIRRQVLKLLLDYKCDPMLQFKGRSAMDVALSLNINIFDIFIKCPLTNLNSIINENNQTILSKIFTMSFSKTLPLDDRLQMITNLLLFGADPFIECRYGEDKYDNLFMYANKMCTNIESSHVKPYIPAKGVDSKVKKATPPKRDEKLTIKSSGKLAVDDVNDYKQTLDLVTECARMLFIRWLQATLAKELIEIVHRYNHRHWNVIIKEHENKRATGLWLTPQRCLEIWNILKTTKRKIYNQKRTLKLTLSILQYYFRNPKDYFCDCYISAQEKACVENDVWHLLSDQKVDSSMASDITLARPYVMPEIIINANKKFNVCFECLLPFKESKIDCPYCKIIAFCKYECMRVNMDRSNCHPCRELVKAKYFSSPIESVESPLIDTIRS